MNDYFNPSSEANKLDPIPSGLSGVLAFQREKRYRQLMEIQRQLSQTEANSKAAQYRTYEAEEGQRAAARGQATSEADLATQLARNKQNTPEYAPAVTAGAIGEAQTKTAKGAVDAATTPNQITTKKSELDAQAQTHRLQKAESLLTHMDMLEPTFQDQTPVAPGVTRGQQNYQNFTKQLPPGAAESLGLPAQYNPQVNKAIREKLVNSVGEARKQAEIKATADYHIKVGEGHDKATVKSAELRSQAARRDALNSFQRAVSTGNEFAIMTAGEMILGVYADDLDPRTKASIESITRKAQIGYSNKMARGQQGVGDIRNPGSTAARIRESLGGAEGSGIRPPGGAGGTVLRYDNKGNRVE